MDHSASTLIGRAISAPVILFALAVPLAAAEFNMGVTAAGIRPGNHVAGPVLSPESLAHRVVLLEFWGVNCPPCIRSMPLLEELHKTLGPQGLVNNKDPETAEEATFVVEQLEARGRAMLAEAVSAKDVDPARAAGLIQRCTVLFKGSEIGVEAAKLNGQWRKDKPFQAAVKAGEQLVRLERMRAYVLDQLGGQPNEPLTPQMAAAVPPAFKRQLVSLAQGIERAAPGSAVAQKAATIAAEFEPVTATP